MTEKKRIIYLEKLRVFALLLVLYTHSNQLGVMYFEASQTGIGFWVSLFMLPISQCCVILFFMISGALLLTKQESIKRLFLHRVLPMAIVTTLFVLIQYVQNCISYHRSFSMEEFGKALYSKGSITEHWFLYAYLSFLLILPFLRAMVKGMEENSLYLYLLALALVFSAVFPMWEAVTDWEATSLSLPLAEHIILYPLLGFYLHHKEAYTEQKQKLLAFNIIGVVVAVGNCFMNYHSYTRGNVAAYTTLFLPLYACLFFANWKRFAAGDKCDKVWLFAGAGVFGTYLFEHQLRLIFAPLEHWIETLPVPYLANAGYLILLAAAGIVVTNGLKVIPGVKKLL